eukprot:scaffold115190_cov20-Tisochrysis_lutea.AAC.1
MGGCGGRPCRSHAAVRGRSGHAASFPGVFFLSVWGSKQMRQCCFKCHTQLYLIIISFYTTCVLLMGQSLPSKNCGRDARHMHAVLPFFVVHPTHMSELAVFVSEKCVLAHERFCVL